MGSGIPISHKRIERMTCDSSLPLVRNNGPGPQRFRSDRNVGGRVFGFVLLPSQHRSPKHQACSVKNHCQYKPTENFQRHVDD